MREQAQHGGLRHWWLSGVLVLLAGAYLGRWLLMRPSPVVVQRQVQQQLWAQVNESPQPVPQLHAAGIAALQHGDNAGALHSFLMALTHAPTLVLGWYHAGVSYTNMGRQQEALAAFQNATKVEPRFADAWLNIGLLETERNDLLAAKTALRQAGDLDPDLELAQLALARACLKSGDVAAAEKLARAAVQRAPRSANAWLALGDMLAERAEPNATAEAVRCFERAIQVKPDSYGYFRLGQMALRLNQLPAALPALRHATELDPLNPTPWYLLARAQAAAGLPAADATLQQARRVHEWAHQTKVLASAIAQEPQRAANYFQLAAVEAKMGQRQAAINTYRHGLALAPNQAAARHALNALEAVTTP